MIKYSFGQVISLGFSFILTKMFYPKARLVRFPIDIRGKRNIKLGENFTSGYSCRIETHNKIKKDTIIIGKNVQINDFVHIVAREQVKIGDNVLIASKVFITDLQHGSYKGNQKDSDPLIPPISRELFSDPVIIEDNVWIGEFVSIMPGCIIGKGSIIGSNSVVTKTIPPFSIAVGIPAKVIKVFNFTTHRWDKI